MTLAARAEALLVRHWWQRQPTWLAWLLWPLSLVYGSLQHLHARQQARAAVRPLPVPVLVVGNHVVGGAGKTPTVIAVVQGLQQAGKRPGVISRGHGRRADTVQAVQPDSTAQEVGDEPLLIQRRCGVPVWVGRDRAAAGRALCNTHPDVDVLVSDDGLQHIALARQAELILFDERGAGNGLLLPAGPLRSRLPAAVPPRALVLYTSGQVSTALPGALALRHIHDAWPLQAWLAGDRSQCQPLQALRGRPLLAAAGMAAPEKFFGMLQALGLTLQRLPLPDHHAYTTLPWPAGTADVITTEKDAVKLEPARLGGTRVWVVPLDLTLPAGLLADLIALLSPAP